MPSIQVDRLMMNRIRTRRMGMAILGMFVGCLVALHVQGLLTVQRRIPGKGQVVAANLQIYWDAECTQIVSEIDWDNLGRETYLQSRSSQRMSAMSASTFPCQRRTGTHQRLATMSHFRGTIRALLCSRIKQIPIRLFLTGPGVYRESENSVLTFWSRRSRLRMVEA